MDFTNMTFCGRLTSDPESFETKRGGTMCKFTVATSRRVGKGEERTSFLPVLVTGTEAENCAKFLSKGRQVLVNATFETDTYTDRNDVKRKGFTFVVGHNGFVQFGAGGAKSNKSSSSDSSGRSSAVEKITNKLKRDSGI